MRDSADRFFGALSGQMLLVRNVENDDYLGQVKLLKVSFAPQG